MYTSIATAILAMATCLIGSVVAAPSLDVGGPATLTWTGEVVANSGAITLVGNDIDHILAQIHDINPGYNANLAIRDDIPPEPTVQWRQCGVFATADKRNFQQIQYDLRKAGGTCTIPARKCLRLKCWNTSGIYVCNDNDNDVTQPCTTFADFASDVGKNCCTSPYTKSKSLSGQAFSDQGWNVCVGYANCNHASDADAPSIFGLPGLNGECKD